MTPFNTRQSRRFRENVGTSRQRMEDLKRMNVGVCFKAPQGRHMRSIEGLVIRNI